MHDPKNNTTKEQEELINLTNGEIEIEHPQGDIAFIHDIANLQNKIWRQQ